MSAAQVIVGLGGIAYPICIEKMMRMYGFRGKFLSVSITYVYNINTILILNYIITYANMSSCICSIITIMQNMKHHN